MEKRFEPTGICKSRHTRHTRHNPSQPVTGDGFRGQFVTALTGCDGFDGCDGFLGDLLCNSHFER